MLNQLVKSVYFLLRILDKFHLSAAHHAVVSPAIGTRPFRCPLDKLVHAVHLEIYIGIVVQNVYFSALHSAMQIKNQVIALALISEIEGDDIRFPVIHHT